MLSCDYVTEPLEEKTGGVDTDKCPEPIFTANTNTKRNVLIEDLTGHKCTGCPEAAYIIEQVKQAYPGQVVAIGLHVSDFFASPDPVGSGSFETDFRTSAGDDLFNDFTPSSLPKGMINRSDTVLNNGGFLFPKSNFLNATARFINQTPLANLQIITSFDNSDRTLCVYIETEALANLTGDYNLVVAITEDSIVDWQKSDGTVPTYPAGDISNYIHSHVLRANVNGTYGETIIPTSISNGDKLVNGYTTTLNGNWNESNINVIAYLIKNSTKEVLQVVENHL
jgi:hypothetical protein